MKNLTVTQKGEKYTLVYNPIQGKSMFIPNEWGLEEKEVEQLPVFRTYGTGSYTPVVTNEKRYLETYKCPVEGYLFELSEEYLEFKSTSYQIAANYRSVTCQVAKPLRTFRVNELWDRNPSNILPSIMDEELNVVEKQSNGEIQSLLTVFYCFTEKAVETFEPIYQKKVDCLTAQIESWEEQQLKNAPATIYGLKITGARRNPNDTATFIFEDGGDLHENYIFNFPTEKPEKAEAVRKVSRGFKFLFRGEWVDSLVDLNPEVNF